MLKSKVRRIPQVCLKNGGPSSKKKPDLVSDSEKVPWGKGEKESDCSVSSIYWRCDEKALETRCWHSMEAFF